VVFVAVTAAVQPRFLDLANIKFVLINATVFALLAVGETMVWSAGTSTCPSARW